MTERKKSKLLIVGAGPAGNTAAIYGARACLSPLLLTGPLPGGQLTTTHMVENWPGTPRGINGPELMSQMLQQVERLGVEVVQDQIVEAQLVRSPFLLKGELFSYQTESLIIATGASAKYLGLPSEAAFLGKGISACATCDGFLYKDQPVAVIGGGNTAVQEALYLTTIASQVLLVHRRDQFRAEATLLRALNRAISNKQIICLTDAEVEDFIGTEDTGLEGIYVRDRKRATVDFYAIKACFVAIGHTPNSKPFSNQVACSDGYIQTGFNPQQRTSTSIPGVFAAGDVAESKYQQAITAAATGCMAALDAQQFLQQHQITD